MIIARGIRVLVNRTVLYAVTKPRHSLLFTVIIFLCCYIAVISRLTSMAHPEVGFNYDREIIFDNAPISRAADDKNSSFDASIQSRWRLAMERGYFRYNLTTPTIREIPGAMNLVALHNRARGALRRPPEPFSHVQQPFDWDKFHFGLVKQHEVLLKLIPDVRYAGPTTHEDWEFYNDILINDSPIEDSHVLLVPHRGMTDGSPQIISEYGLRLAVDLLLLSNLRNWFVVFNSLCAMASVNHQHFQAMYTQLPLAVQSWETVPVCNSLYRLSDSYHSFAFVVSWRGTGDQFALDIMRVLKVLVSNDIAHNLVMVRGESVSSVLYSGKLVPRALIFPRKHFVGAKQQSMEFNVAALELAGLLVMYGDEKEFESMTEEKATSLFASAQLSNSVLHSLMAEVVSNFQISDDEA